MTAKTLGSATAGLHGIDTNTTISLNAARKVKEKGYTFAIRYLTRKETPPAGDLTAAEADDILAGGLKLMVVQHVAKAGWEPTDEKGTTYGTNAAAHAKDCGLPNGTQIWLDLEGINHTTPAETVISYCNAWFSAVSAANFTHGVYVGANCILNGQQLFHRLQTAHYWKSGSTVPDIPLRGYCMEQTIIEGDMVAGLAIDRNVVTGDKFGNFPLWVEPAAAAPAVKVLGGAGGGAGAGLAVAPDGGDGEAGLLAMATERDVKDAMQRLIDFRNANNPGSKPRYWAVADFRLHSSKRRLHVFDRVSQSCDSYLCAHGKGSEGTKDDGMATVFSNASGSNASSLGIYSCAETYIGENGYSLKLDGQEESNANARPRSIVVHGAEYVSDHFVKLTGRLGRSHGCPAVEEPLAEKIIDQLKNGSYLIIIGNNTGG